MSAFRPRSLAAGLALLAMAVAGVAQAPPKRPLTHADYEIWNTASQLTLSPDGKWVAYSLTPAEGDGAVVVRSMTSDAEYRVAKGGRPAATADAGEAGATPPVPANLPPGLAGRLGGGAVASGPQFSPDGKKVFFSLTPTKADADKARAEKKGPAAAPRAVVAVMELATGKVVERIEKARSFRVVGESPAYLVIQKEAKPDEQVPAAGAGAVAGGPAATSGTPPPTTGGAQGGPPVGGGRTGGGFRRGGTQPGATPNAPQQATPRPTFGTELVVRNLATGAERTFADVAEFTVSKDAKVLVYAAASKKDETNGVYAVDLDSQAGAFPVRAGKGRYTRLTWDDKQTRLAFFFDESPALPVATPTPPAAPQPPGATPPAPPERVAAKLKVFLWERAPREPVSTTAKAVFHEATELLGPTTPGLKAGFALSSGLLRFTEDGLKLALNVVPAPKDDPKPATPAAPPTARAADERIDLDLWHWKDEQIQPMQKVRGPADRTRSQPAAYFFDTKQFRHLADEDTSVGVPDFGDWAVASNPKPYRYLTGYGANLSDHTLVNVRTGEVKPTLKAATGGLTLSPKGTSAVTFDGKDWHAVAVPGGAKVNLTARLKEKFFNEEFDSPMEAPAYGLAGCTSDDKFVLVSDKYDVWKLAVDGSSATNLTAVGRELKTRFRAIRLRNDEDDEPVRGFDLSKPLLLAATNLATRDTGFYRLEPGGKPRLLVMGARQYGTPVKAKKSDAMLLTIGTFFDYADYYATGPDFREFRRVTDVNPRKSEFNWGKAELVTYKSADGVELSGVLVKPEDFDPAKKYPMIVYIYERLSDGLHTFRMPAAGTSINPTYYASNGYLVFMPDIAYTVGYPGASAMKCVLPAIQSVVDKGYVNEAAIGIQGHSWGGYQIAYMVTQTNRFKAAAAGAPVSDMVSAYGGVRWGTGLPRQFQYERTQSRIGATLWQAPLKYIENSPIFHADKVTTPLMILHNDQDDAVPWYQGIEYYLALRRLGKECYLFNYNGELHGLRKKATQRDYTLRMQQFFDHHLKGAPMPEWMAKGVPFADREKEKEQWKGQFQAEKK